MVFLLFKAPFNVFPQGINQLHSAHIVNSLEQFITILIFILSLPYSQTSSFVCNA